MKGELTMTTNELKDLLASKLREEGTYFTRQHISATICICICICICLCFCICFCLGWGW